MQEVKKPSRRPLICYYLAALLILMLLNMTFFPAVLEKPVQDVTYDQFMCTLCTGRKRPANHGGSE